MKKVVLTVAVLLGGLSTFATSTLANNPTDAIVVSVQEEYTEIKAEDLPQAVQDALKADYETATLEKAYVNEQEQYKLDITIDGETSSVFADKDGNWIIQE